MALLGKFAKGGEIIKSCSLFENSEEKRDIVVAQAYLEAREVDKRLQAALKFRKQERPEPKIDCSRKIL